MTQANEESPGALESNADEGPSADETERRLERFGPNALPEAKRRSLLSVFVGQFKMENSTVGWA